MAVVLLLLKVVAGGLLGLVLLHSILRLVRRFVKFPAPAIAGRILAGPWRLRMYPAETLIERSGIREGMRVLELGCGSGAYTLSVARAVGDNGKVEALDIQEDMLTQLKQKLSRIENRDIDNIQIHQHSAYDLPFEDGVMDLVYTIAVLQEIPDKHKALREVWRVLKPGGILAVTELFQDPDYPLMSTTIRDGTSAGFSAQANEGSFWYYTVRFEKT
jgi:SAM-dependent methyltransferase